MEGPSEQAGDRGWVYPRRFAPVDGGCSDGARLDVRSPKAAARRSTARTPFQLARTTITRGMLTRKLRFAGDSSLEGNGFEPSVPQQIRSHFRESSPVSHAGLTVSRPGTGSSNLSPSSRESANHRFHGGGADRRPQKARPRRTVRSICGNKGNRAAGVAPRPTPRPVLVQSSAKG
jgi:hypothetical protein